MDSNVKLLKDDSYSKKVDPIQYQSMVSSLLYVVKATRPDIAHAVGIVVPHQHKHIWLPLREFSNTLMAPLI